MTNTLEFYLNLPYRVEIMPLSEEDGGGFMASIPQLGRKALCADGPTIQEAVNRLREIQKERFATYLEEGTPIPEPEPDIDEYSGRFVVRIPKYLHRELALRAKENNVSLNQFVSSLLAGGLQREVGHALTEKLIEERTVRVSNRPSPPYDYKDDLVPPVTARSMLREDVCQAA